MTKNNLIKNVAILVDFLISAAASAIQKTLPEISNLLFGISAIVLLIAVICVIIDFVSARKVK